MWLRQAAYSSRDHLVYYSQWLASSTDLHNLAEGQNDPRDSAAIIEMSALSPNYRVLKRETSSKLARLRSAKKYDSSVVVVMFVAQICYYN